MMNLNQKLTSLAIATMPVMPVVNAAIVTLVITANSSTGVAIAQTASPSFVGKTWEGENKNFRVQFYQKGNTYNGKIVGLAPGAETKDVKNPDPKLRSRNLIGSIMFQGYTYDPAKKQLTGGVVYVPEMGRILKPKLTVVSDDRLEMQVSMGMMSRTVALTAVK
jgi:uncharacterized protein (DUF2147 family)